MTTLDGWYLNPHRSQYAMDADPYTRSAGCGPTSAANGANASTSGRTNLTGDQFRNLVPRAEETNPKTPGWSLGDIAKACGKLGLDWSSRAGTGWSALRSNHAAGRYIVLQGDSDRFSDSTCSGAFDGDHAIGIHPATDGSRWWIDDPICKTGRWEEEAVLRRYAEKFNPGVSFGMFMTPVRRGPVETYPVPPSLGPKPAGATMWVSTDELARLWQSRLGILRPIPGVPPAFTFRAWAGPNTTKVWAPGPASMKLSRAVFRQVLGPPHDGLWIRVTDQGSDWHHL